MKYPRLETRKKEVKVFERADGSETQDVEIALSEYFDQLLESAGAGPYAERREIADLLAGDAKLVEAFWQAVLDAQETGA
jgi:hypothetical protein